MKFKYLLLTFVAVLFSHLALAQPFSVKLKLVEEKTSEPVQFATVSVTPAGTTKALRYALTDDKGEATVTRVGKGAYVIKVQIMGYKNY